MNSMTVQPQLPEANICHLPREKTVVWSSLPLILKLCSQVLNFSASFQPVELVRSSTEISCPSEVKRTIVLAFSIPPQTATHSLPWNPSSECSPHFLCDKYCTSFFVWLRRPNYSGLHNYLYSCIYIMNEYSCAPIIEANILFAWKNNISSIVTSHRAPSGRVSNLDPAESTKERLFDHYHNVFICICCA